MARRGAAVGRRDLGQWREQQPGQALRLGVGKPQPGRQAIDLFRLDPAVAQQRRQPQQRIGGRPGRQEPVQLRRGHPPGQQLRQDARRPHLRQRRADARGRQDQPQLLPHALARQPVDAGSELGAGGQRFGVGRAAAEARREAEEAQIRR